jgi:hypothetical protein
LRESFSGPAVRQTLGAADEPGAPLATLKDRNERVLINGFYDDVAEPDPDDMAQLRRVAAQRDDDLQRRDYSPSRTRRARR